MGHWEAVLAELIEERKKLDDLIEIAEARVGRAQAEPGAEAAGGTSIRTDTFFGLKAPEAIRKYLVIAKAPKAPKDIADALERGGYQSTSKDLVNTLRTSLRRMHENDEVAQVGNDWGLAEWYPGRSRKKPKGNGDNEPDNLNDAVPLAT